MPRKGHCEPPRTRDQASKSTPKVWAQLERINRDPIYNGSIESLETVIDALVEETIKISNDAGYIFAKIRDEAGIKNLETVAAVEDAINQVTSEPLKDKLKDALSTIRRDLALRHSIKPLQAAVSEFSKPPCSLTTSQYEKCVESLKEVGRELIKPRENRKDVPPFPFGSEWNLVDRYFFVYSKQALGRELMELGKAFDMKIKSDPAWQQERTSWEDFAAWSHHYTISPKTLVDQSALILRKDVVIHLRSAQAIVKTRDRSEESRTELARLLSQAYDAVRNLVTHTEHYHQVRATSTASLAHFPISRRLLSR